MRRFVLLAAGFTVASLTLLSSSDASAATFVGSHSAGPAVGAGWEFPEPDGSFSGVFVFAGDEKHREGGRPVASRNVFVEIFHFSPGTDPDDPADDSVRFILGGRQLAEGELVISGRGLDSATLSATVEGQDCTFTGPPGPDPPDPQDCADATIEVDLEWTTTGPLATHQGSFHDRFDGCISNSNFSFTSRPAEVSGSVTFDGTDYTRGEPATFGDLIARSRDHFVSIGDCFFGPHAGP